MPRQTAVEKELAELRMRLVALLGKTAPHYSDIARLAVIDDVMGMLAIQRCHVCGCTQDNACDGGCYWVKHDLCSECVA